MVIDEFADLASELPDFVDSLVKIAQKGRSLGVHMLLATQRPAGAIKDNIRANTNYRIALRTQRPGDSEDVIDVKDAAFLPRSIPGRALIRYGSDQPVPFQAASVSLSTIGTMTRPVSVRWFDPAVRPDERILVETTPTAASASNGSNDDSGGGLNGGTQGGSSVGLADATVMCRIINQAAELAGVGRVRSVWADTLTAETTSVSTLNELCDLIGEGGVWRLGVADDPKRQSHQDWGWTPGIDTNLIAYGTGEAGVTALCVTAAGFAHASAEPFEVFGLDFNNTGLDTIAGFGSVGAVISGGERERITRLLGYLSDELDQRRRNPAPSHQILVLVDGYVGFRSEFESPADYVYQDAMARIVRDGPANGIHTIIGAHQPAAVPNAIASTVGNRVAFKLVDKNDYATLGLSLKAIPNLQAGQAINTTTGLVIQTRSLSETALSQLSRLPAEREPCRIGTLPYVVKPDEISGETVLASVSWRIPIGITDDKLDTAFIDLGCFEHLLVCGPAKSGRTSQLFVIAGLLAAAENPPEIVGLAPERSQLHQSDFDTYTSPYDIADLVGRTANPLAVLIDDAARVDPDNVLADLFANGNEQLHVIATERSDLIRNSFNHWLRDLRQQGTGMILRAQHEADNDLFGVRIPRHGHPPTEQLAATINNGAATIIRPITHNPT